MASTAISHYRADDRVPAPTVFCYVVRARRRAARRDRRGTIADHAPARGRWHAMDRARPELGRCRDRSRYLDFRVRVDLGAPRRELNAARPRRENGPSPRLPSTSRARTAISSAAMLACSGGARRGSHRGEEAHSAAGARRRNKWARTRYRFSLAPPPCGPPPAIVTSRILTILASGRRHLGVKKASLPSK